MHAPPTTDPTAVPFPELLIGDHVVDREDPATRLVVTKRHARSKTVADVTANGDSTIAALNPAYAPDSRPVGVVYTSDRLLSVDDETTYTFPRERLRLVAATTANDGYPVPDAVVRALLDPVYDVTISDTRTPLGDGPTVGQEMPAPPTLLDPRGIEAFSRFKEVEPELDTLAIAFDEQAFARPCVFCNPPSAVYERGVVNAELTLVDEDVDRVAHTCETCIADAPTLEVA